MKDAEDSAFAAILNGWKGSAVEARLTLNERYQAAHAALRSLRVLPVHSRMEAMGMEAVYTSDPDIDFQVWVEAENPVVQVDWLEQHTRPTLRDWGSGRG